MNQRPARIRLAIVGLLTLLMLATVALPAEGATLKRRQGSEDLAYRLTNCLRTGGYVTVAGRCQAYGSGRFSKYVPPLKRSQKIDNKVAWPWAQTSVKFYGTRSCWIGHARNSSTVDSRFARVALRHTVNGENMGCGFYGKSSETVVRVLRMWQAERKWGGWHWRQVKSGDFKSIGVGVASLGTRKTQFVVDFYGKRVS